MLKLFMMCLLGAFSWGMALILSLDSGILVLTLMATLVVAFSSNPHVSVTLIRVELMTVSAMAVLAVMGLSGSVNLILLFMFFSVAVVDAVVGLSLLSVLMRTSREEVLQMSL